VFNIPETYNVDIYNMGVFRYEGLYIGMPTVYHKTGQVSRDWPGFADWVVTPEQMAAYRQSGDWSGFHHVQLACSRDLKAWDRLGDRQPFLDLSPVGAGAYDLATILGPSAPVEHGDELWFYYTGLKKYGGPTPMHGPDRDQGAICLAVLRRDGFVSLDAGEREGQLVTHPFTWEGSALHVNVDAPHGELRAEVLDRAGSVLASSASLAGDLTDGTVRWATGNVAGLKRKAVSLRFTLRHARLYAYWTA
jgi:hypothetical protein